MGHGSTHTILGERMERSTADGTIVIRTTEAKLRDAERRLSREIRNLNDLPESLHYVSAAAFFFQIMQAAALVIVAFNKSDKKWFWYTSYPGLDDYEGQQPQVQEIAQFSIVWLAPVFVFMSAMDHLCSLLFRDTYEWYLKRSQNPFRWTEYSFSAALMRFVIAMLAGITDIHLLICLFTLTSMTIQGGATCEAVNAKARADDLPMYWRPFYTAWISQIVSWGIIFSYFINSVTEGTMSGGAAWPIMIVLFLLDAAFAVLFSLQWLQIPPFDGTFAKVPCSCHYNDGDSFLTCFLLCFWCLFTEYAHGEIGFIILSFTAKSLLAWIVVTGVLHENSDLQQ